MQWTGGHTNRVSFFLNGSPFYSPNPIVHTGYQAGGGSPYAVHLVNHRVVLPAGTTDHVITIRWNAADSTAACTVVERLITADVYDMPVDLSPIPLGGSGGGGGGAALLDDLLDVDAAAPTTSLGRSTTTTQAFAFYDALPTQIRFDRLLIPSVPAI